MGKKMILGLVFALGANMAFADNGCFPENDLKFSHKTKSANMSKTEFDQVIKRALDVYGRALGKVS